MTVPQQMSAPIGNEGGVGTLVTVGMPDGALLIAKAVCSRAHKCYPLQCTTMPTTHGVRTQRVHRHGMRARGQGLEGTVKHKNKHVALPCSETRNSGAQAPGTRQTAARVPRLTTFQAASRLAPTRSPPACGAGATKHSYLKQAGFTLAQT